MSSEDRSAIIFHIQVEHGHSRSSSSSPGVAGIEVSDVHLSMYQRHVVRLESPDIQECANW